MYMHTDKLAGFGAVHDMVRGLPLSQVVETASESMRNTLYGHRPTDVPAPRLDPTPPQWDSLPVRAVASL